ncbi:hypothetical protein BKP56_13105 [Marinilactibacillus sp. 15R]|uniref:hypothetical protein n=1 Tax=Marinilactibacillus sp. 15R TaxID=1911586 RepID=UPI00090BB8CA|nr:hypothetical protein [Marinilactibacillus sp. 15R]API90128.1 hypothetical protein BKP56_13105 [Marinilactibacillus sp. 15R]
MKKDTIFFLTDFDETELKSKIEELLSVISESDKKIFSKYVELTRHIIELDKLFYVFRYNLKNLLDHFTLYTNDLIERLDNDLTEDQYYYQINALTINLISSAKTLTESIEVCMKNFLPKETFDSFKLRILSKPYDECFSYRFLLHLRNYSQHGHLPVNIHDQRAYFDLDDILSMPHFDLKKSLKEEIRELKVDIYNEFGHLPYISYVHTIAKFNLVITEIYSNYLNEIKPVLMGLNEEKSELLHDTKFQLINLDRSISNTVFYDFDGENYHCFNRNDNSIATYAGMKKEAKKILKKETQYYKEIEIKNR